MALPCAAQNMIVVDNPAARPAESEFRIAGDAFLANDHVPIRDFDSEVWPADYRVRSGQNLSLFSARMAVGAAYRGFQVDYLRRSDWLLQASGDTAHAYFITQTDQLITSGRNLQIDYALNGFDADGLRLGLAAQAPGMSGTRLGFAFNVLRGLRLRAEDARATYSSTGNSASLVGRREVWYSEMRPSSDDAGITAFQPFAEESVPARGSGYSFDLGLHHVSDNGWQLMLSANDLAGWIEWDNLPHVQQNITISNITSDSFTSNGTPVVSGFNDYRDYRLRLPVKYKVAAVLPVAGAVAVSADLTRVRGISFPQLGAHWTLREAAGISVNYDTRFHSIGLSGQWRGFTVGVRTDALRRAASRTLGIVASYVHPL